MTTTPAMDAYGEQNDLVAILALRFGFVSDSVRRSIRSLDDLALLGALIEEAKEAETWASFVNQCKAQMAGCKPA